jgi:hypothetical protein
MSRITVRQRSAMAEAIMDIDIHWAQTFQAAGLSHLDYCDLFTQMWLRRKEALRKTELYALMPNVCPRTAVKYVQSAIDGGFLLEHPGTHDRRVRLVTLSDKVREDLERFLDYSARRFRDALME